MFIDCVGIRKAIKEIEFSRTGKRYDEMDFGIYEIKCQCCKNHFTSVSRNGEYEICPECGWAQTFKENEIVINNYVSLKMYQFLYHVITFVERVFK